MGHHRSPPPPLRACNHPEKVRECYKTDRGSGRREGGAGFHPSSRRRRGTGFVRTAEKCGKVGSSVSQLALKDSLTRTHFHEYGQLLVCTENRK